MNAIKISRVVKQGEILKTIKEHASELIELRNSEASSGCAGGNPSSYFAAAEISGRSKFASWRDEGAQYHHLPGFGFKFEIHRSILSPYQQFDSKLIAFAGRGMYTVIKDVSKVELWISLSGGYDFFYVLNAVRTGESFEPFIVEGKKDVIKKLETKQGLRISANVGDDEVRAVVSDIVNAEVESMILDFISIFDAEIPTLHSLKPLYREKDEEGTRLWDDQGLQSKEYYDLRKKIARRLLKRLMAVLKDHRVPYRTTWGLHSFVGGFLDTNKEYGLLASCWLVFILLKDKISGYLKGYEKSRLERLKAAKTREKERARGA